MSAAVVYVVRLRRPLCHARHGARPERSRGIFWTCDLPNRVRQHLTGRGSALLNAANAYGIRWDVVHVIACPSWKAARALERHIKRSRHVTRWCPVERRRAGRATVSFAPGRTADTRRSVAEALASVPAEVRALTSGPDALTPRGVPFARRDFDPDRAAALKRSGPAAPPFLTLAGPRAALAA